MNNTYDKVTRPHGRVPKLVYSTTGRRMQTPSDAPIWKYLDGISPIILISLVRPIFRMTSDPKSSGLCYRARSFKGHAVSARSIVSYLL